MRRILRENLLRDLWKVGEAASDWTVRVPWAEVQGMRGLTANEIRRVGAWLRSDDLVELHEDGPSLTAAGELAARALVRKHRLWELYLTRQLELAADHVHRDADAMEHTLSEDAVEALDEKLGRPQFDPHGQLIPRLDVPLEQMVRSAA